MAQTSKLLDDKVVEKAKDQLRKVGKAALMTRKLEAIISAKKHGITKVAEIYDITRKTLTSWIKCVKNDNLTGLSAPAGRKRKSKLNDTHRTKIIEWLKADSQLTLEAVKLKIKEIYNIEISKSTVHREIQRLNYSYIKPRPQHFKQDQDQVTEFKKKD
jgi:transposase